MFMMRGATGRFHALHLSIRILVAALLAALLDHTHALQPSAAALQELPAPGSTAAAQLLSNPNTSGEVRDWYTFHWDSTLITQQKTRSFLVQLQQQYTSSRRPGSKKAAAAGRHLQNSSNTANMQPFLRVSKDVLNYLRFQRSKAVLPLLRSYSASSSEELALSEVDEDVLQVELDKLLNPEALGQFYKTFSSKCKHYSHKPVATSSSGSVHTAAAGRKMLHQHHPVLMSYNPQHHHHHHQQQAVQQQGRSGPPAAALQRRLQQPGNPSNSPNSPGQGRRLSSPGKPSIAEIFSDRHPQNLEEMLCSISALSPSGLEGMTFAGVPADIAQGTQSEPNSSSNSESDSAESATPSEVGHTATTPNVHPRTHPVSVSRQAPQAWPSLAVRTPHQQLNSSKAAGIWGGTRSAAVSNATQAGSSQSAAGEVVTGNGASGTSSDAYYDHSADQVGYMPAASTPSVQQGNDTSSVDGDSGSSSSSGGGGSIQCPAKMEKAGAPINIIVPIVFHVLRYGGKDGYYMPPMWTDDSSSNPQMSAQHLIDRTNWYYKGTGIQFKLQEVRVDPLKYPYLLLNSKSRWQQCSVHSSDSYWPCNSCLEKIASNRSLAPLYKEFVINIFVSGSASEPLCREAADDYFSCSDIARGCSNAVGPWSPSEDLEVLGVKANWYTEGTAGVDWVWISFDDFNPDVFNNNVTAWDGGAATVAHEVGHYLGLLHTFAGVYDCEGDGADYGDRVPDTPASDSAQTFAYYSVDMYRELSQWCSAFREGGQPSPKALLKYNSCPAGGQVVGDYIDPIFNVMNYPPDVCCMSFTPGQVARMQKMVSQYRPKMVARYTV